MLALLLATGTSIIVAGQPIDVGRPVVLWNDPEGFNGYAETCVESAAIGKSPCCERTFKRFAARSGLRARSLDALREIVSQLVLHLDGCVNSRSCFHSMHDLPRPDGGCGLSAHFMVDADGTIYQTLDVLERAWHAEEVNSISIGVEICNRGDAGRNELDRLPADYRTRPVHDVVINGHHIHAFEFRSEQYESVIALARALVKTFPKIPPVVPEHDGKVIMETLPKPLAFAGIVGHFNVDLQRQKWDPGAFDWQRLLRALRAFHFPLPVRNFDEVPEAAPTLAAATRALYRNAEERASQFFPLGPGRLWHSGVHLRGTPGAPVVAPAHGRLLAARVATSDDGPSRAMVLLRHDLTIGGRPIVFYSLLAHLGSDEISDHARAPWLRDLARGPHTVALADLRAGKVALLDRPIEAGDVVGVLGADELHFEIFAPERLDAVLGRTFRYLEAAADGPLVRRASLVELVDSDGNGVILPDELRTFFSSGDPEKRQALRRLAVRHTHEWGDRLGEAAYVNAPELGNVPEPERRKLYRRAIAPYVFWTDALSSHAGLPASQAVYFFHPITFLASLAAHSGGFELHWPAHAPIGDRDLDATPVPASALSMPGRTAEPPIFGPVQNAEAETRRKSDIPLIVLPQSH